MLSCIKTYKSIFTVIISGSCSSNIISTSTYTLFTLLCEYITTTLNKLLICCNLDYFSK